MSEFPISLAGDGALTLPQLIELTTLSRSTIYRYISMGKIKPVKIGQRRIAFRKSDARELLASGERANAA